MNEFSKKILGNQMLIMLSQEMVNKKRHLSRKEALEILAYVTDKIENPPINWEAIQRTAENQINRWEDPIQMSNHSASNSDRVNSAKYSE